MHLRTKTRRIAVSALRTASLLVFLLVSAVATAANNASYRLIHQIVVGPVELTGLSVGSVTLAKETTVDGFDNLSNLSIKSGGLKIYADAARTRPLLTAELAQDSQGGTPGILAGMFRQTNGQITEIRLHNLKLRLKGVKFLQPVVGGEAAISPQTIVTLINVGEGVIAADSSNANLQLAVSGMTLHGAGIRWATLPFHVDLRTSGPATLKLGLLSDDLRIDSGRLTTGSALHIKFDAPLRGFFPDHDVEPGSADFAPLVIDVHSGVPTIVADKVMVPKPHLHYTPMPAVPVAAASALIAEKLGSSGGTQSGELAFGAPAAKSLVVTPDSYAAVDLLNNWWEGASDSLIPTGLSNFRYVKTAALATLYRSAAQAEDDPNHLYRVSLADQSNVLTTATVETFPAPAGTQLSRRQHYMCVAIGKLTGWAAVLAITALTEVSVPAEVAGAVARAFNLGLSPWYGLPVVTGVYFATSGLMAVPGAQVGQVVCEVLVGRFSDSKPKPIIGSPRNGQEPFQQRYGDYVQALNVSPGGSTYKQILNDAAVSQSDYRKLLEARAQAESSQAASDAARLKQLESDIAAANARMERQIALTNRTTTTNAIRQAEASAAAQRAAAAGAGVVPIPIPVGGSPPTIKTQIINTTPTSPNK